MRQLARMFVVWYKRVGQRGKDMLSATAFNQQVCTHTRVLGKSAVLLPYLASTLCIFVLVCTL